MLDTLSLASIAIATCLSALVSILSSHSSRARVGAGMGTARDLSLLSGITDPRELQSVFGPPDMNRVWRSVTLDFVNAEKRPTGYLLSDQRVDQACAGVAVIALFWPHDILQALLLLAALVQIGGWISSTQLPK